MERDGWLDGWMAEATAVSSIKRMFGEYASAIRFQNMIKEMTMRYHCTICLDELHKMDGNNLRKIRYTTGQSFTGCSLE
jgi:hypothetical protein